MLAKQSLNDIYEDHAEMVFNLSLNYLQNQQEAEEVTQDVFLKVHERLHKFEGRSKLKTWIYRITVNACLDQLKARKRQKRSGIMVRFFQRGDAQSAPFELPDFDHPGVLLENKEATAALFEKINRLPENQRAALLLKTTEGASQKEIAEVLQIGEKAVESLLSRARMNLSVQLKSEGNRG